MSAERRWTALWHEARCEVLKAARSPGFSLPTVLVPPAFYAFFSFGMQMGTSHHGFKATMATYTIFCAMAPGLFGLGTAVAAEAATGWMDVRCASPLPRSNFVIAKAVVALLFTTLSALLVCAVAIGAGVRLPLAGWVALISVILVACLVFASFGLALGLRAPTAAAAAICNAVFLPAAFLGGLWFPIQALHPWLLSLAYWLPTYHLGQLALSASQVLPGEDLAPHIAITAVWLVGGVAVAAWALMRWNKRSR